MHRYELHPPPKPLRCSCFPRLVHVLNPPHPSPCPQSLNGNTVLHYCYFYNFEELAEYLKSHGADDSLLNSDGLTCYEGINATVVDQM